MHSEDFENKTPAEPFALQVHVGQLLMTLELEYLLSSAYIFKLR